MNKIRKHYKEQLKKEICRYKDYKSNCRFKKKKRRNL